MSWFRCSCWFNFCTLWSFLIVLGSYFAHAALLLSRKWAVWTPRVWFQIQPETLLTCLVCVCFILAWAWRLSGWPKCEWTVHSFILFASLTCSIEVGYFFKSVLLKKVNMKQASLRVLIVSVQSFTPSWRRLQYFTWSWRGEASCPEKQDGL